LGRIARSPACISSRMDNNSTLLCIHRDPAQLSLLQEHGYKLVTATNGHEGLQLFMSQPVDAIVLDFHLGLLDGGIVAAAIKNVKPRVPIVLLAEYMEIPVAALNCVDAVVARSDLAHSLLETVHHVLNVKPVWGHRVKLCAETLLALGPLSKSWDGKERRRPILTQFEGEYLPFS
jgi:CheY-like chemotaxis protein